MSGHSSLHERVVSSGTERAPILLAAALVVGLIGFVPALTLWTATHAAVWVICVGTSYALLALWLERPLAGIVVALIVTGTVGIRAELAPLPYLTTLPGRLGPILWLFLLPLVAGSLVVTVRFTADAALRGAAAEIALGVVVIWAAVVSVLAEPVRPDTAFYFVLFLLQGWLTLAVIRRAVGAGWLGFDDVVGVLTLSVLGNAVFGLAQIVNQGVFRLRRLGEIGYGASNPDALVMQFPLVGRFNVGAFVSGLTTDAYALSTLLVLVLPVLALLAFQRHRSPGLRLAAGGGFLLGAVVLRATRSDAGRGGVVVGLVCLAGLLVASDRYSLSGGVTELRSAASDRRRRADGGIPLSRIGVRSLSSLSSLVTVALGLGFVLFTGVSRVTDGGSVEPRSPTGTLTPRLRQYEAGVDLLLSNPLFGIGGGNFQYVAPRYGIPDGTAMHSIYLLVPVETGFPALVAFVVFLLVVLRAGWSLVVPGTGAGQATGHNPGLAAAAMAGLLAVLAMAGLDHLLLDRPTAFVPFCALCGAIVGASRDDTPDSLTTDGSGGSGGG